VRFGQGGLDLAASSVFGLYDLRAGAFRAPSPLSASARSTEPVAPAPSEATGMLASPRSLNGGSSSVPKAAVPERYSVVSGDSLWQLADRYLGDPYRWPEIHALNRERVPDPDLILPGSEIRLPAGARGPGEAAPPAADPAEMAAVAESLAEIERRAEAQALEPWRFSNPSAVGEGPPERAPEDAGESDDRGAEHGGDDEALGAAITAALLGWRRRAPRADRAPARWLVFNEGTGRFEDAA
jgi:hypothetical protein